MYSTCLFCNSDLGRNEVVEAFPIGRRLAFDAAKGRLWVVCRKCERWNLTPLEERWEAIEACEREYGRTRLRVSTDNVGLARLREGLELVRIGEPQRPELAAWRYGDQFGRRRRDRLVRVGIGLGVVGGAIGGGALLGISAGVGFGGGGYWLWQAARGLYQRVAYGSREAVVARVPGPGGILPVKRKHVPHVRWGLSEGLLYVDVPRGKKQASRLVGDAAERALGTVLPAVNVAGGDRATVQDAVSLIEASDFVGFDFLRERARRPGSRLRLAEEPASVRLALEMAAHEESERRALEGELSLLAEAWKEAEEIAAIADDMFLPDGVQEFLDRHRAR